jgi:hypothetical protein
MAERDVGGVPQGAPAAAAADPHPPGFYDRLLEAAGRDALRHLSEHDSGARPEIEREKLLARTRAVVGTILAGLTPPEEIAYGAPRPWWHPRRPQAAVWRQDPPYLDRARIEEAATLYLGLPFRSPWLDRLLVDLLMATQLFSFGQGGRTMVKSGTPRQWLQGRIYSAAFWAIVALAALTLDRWGWISSVAAATALLSAALLFILETALSVPVLLRQARLFAAICEAYRPLGGVGPLHARTFAEGVAAAAAAGVVWPKPLYRILDDIHRRGGRF